MPEIATVVVDHVHLRVQPGGGEDGIIRALDRGDVLDVLGRHQGAQLRWLKVSDRKTGAIGFVSEAKDDVTHVRVEQERIIDRPAPPPDPDNVLHGEGLPSWFWWAAGGALVVIVGLLALL